MPGSLKKKGYRKVLKNIRDGKAIWLVGTGPRDTGQSDFKNRFTLHDLSRLLPIYDASGYFAIDTHGGARLHQNMMNNMIDPFEEARFFSSLMPNVLTQTLIRATNLWGYRMYSRNTVRLAVESFLPTIDVWRCFDFLNYIPNMAPVAEEVLRAGKIFSPAISFTESPETTDAYYLRVLKEIVSLCGGTKEIILVIKDMAGVGSPARIRRLVDAFLQKYPGLIVLYHRHSTDGLVMPAMAAAAAAGAKLFDVTDDAFSRFYGHPPVRPLVRYLRELGHEVRFDMERADEASDAIRGFIRNYDRFESQFKGFSNDVTAHRMPGGAFPSSFEQAEKGGFLDLMPHILKGMSYGNRIIKYFDVTPGSQITWTTWAAILQRYHKEGGEHSVKRLFSVLDRFFEAGERLEALASCRSERAAAALRGGHRRPEKPPAREVWPPSVRMAERLGLPERLRGRVGREGRSGADSLLPAVEASGRGPGKGAGGDGGRDGPLRHAGGIRPVPDAPEGGDRFPQVP